MSDMRPLRDDLQATFDARRDLGPEYERALIDSFADRLDETITARVRAELERGQGHQAKRSPASQMTPIVLGSMGLAIPLTAIATSNAGRLGLIIVWMAIVAVNVAAAVAVMRRP
ncbi:hypothetical protein [Nonomuraea maritima]|uniref:hypothetical protein n=1 Tax=Nonomuraea maritima TaxID=683260 RepID=UPI0037136983